MNKSLFTNNLPAAHSTQPAFIFLALMSLPLLILTSFSRNIRQLGPSSVIANSSLGVGFVMVMVFILQGTCIINLIIPVLIMDQRYCYGQCPISCLSLLIM